MINKLIIYLIISLTSVSAHCAGFRKEINVYVNNLVTQGSTILNDSTLDQNARLSKAQELIAANLDLKWMAQYSIGNYKKQMNDIQFNKFMKTYSRYIISIYLDLIKNSSAKTTTTNILTIDPIGNDEYIVTTELIREGSQPVIRVDYLVRGSGSDKSKLKIADIITEGVSMINSQREEFSGSIMNNGVDALISNLEKKL